MVPIPQVAMAIKAAASKESLWDSIAAFRKPERDVLDSALNPKCAAQWHFKPSECSTAAL